MKRWILVLVPLIVLGALIAWRVGAKRADVAAQAGMRSMRMNAPALVNLATAQVRDITHRYEATGSVEAPLSVKIAAKVTGRVEYLQVREGDRVKKGQVLVRIDPSEVEGQVQQAMAALAEEEYRLAQARINQSPTNVAVSTQVRQQKATLASASADANQVKQNYQSQLASAAANVTDAQAKVDNAKAALTGAQANLDNASTKLKRVSELYKQGFIAAQDVDDAKAAVAVQEAAVEIARGQINSANAQKQSAENQASIVKTKGKADIEAAEAKVTQAKASLEYANANTVQTSAYKQSLSALQASVTAARAALASARARRADTVLRSPLDGFVTGRFVDPGAMSTSGQPIIAVQFMHQVWATISVPDEVCSKLHISQPADVTLNAFPNRKFSGSVIQINPSADPQSRQFMVRVILDNAKNELKPGMYGRVSLETERIRGVTAVPREAVRRDKTGTYVMVSASGKAERRSVESGVSDAEFVAIDKGIRPGEKVITLSSMPVREGQSIREGSDKGRGGPDRRPGNGGGGSRS